ncbi:hypothetical protein [Saccharothrix sp. ALI-22-I]|nr:hypothetical protein [Saccharothrix sp. ALI-22-I]
MAVIGALDLVEEPPEGTGDTRGTGARPLTADGYFPATRFTALGEGR